MALATFLLFLSSVSAQTIYDIVSSVSLLRSLKCPLIDALRDLSVVANDLGPREAVHQVQFLIEYSTFFC
jgi:hypothetical protein